MSRRFLLPVAIAISLAIPVLAQQHEERGQQRGERESHPEQHGQSTPRANQGHVPPAPQKREAHAKPEVERNYKGHVNQTQHVNNDHWYGHDRADDKRFRIDHPFEHGHFEHFGPSYRYAVGRFDRDHRRFWFAGGFGFEVASWDWPLCADWCWDCGDDFVVYEDSDHVGWYLLYNVHTGVYVHVQYLGG